MKLLIRTLIVLALMIAGAWLNVQLKAYAGLTGNLVWLSAIAMYAVYFLIGVASGTMVSPRFVKNKNKWAYLIPIVAFVIVGAAPLLYYFLTILPFPHLVAYLGEFTYLSWALAGVFFTQAFR